MAGGPFNPLRAAVWQPIPGSGAQPQYGGIPALFVTGSVTPRTPALGNRFALATRLGYTSTSHLTMRYGQGIIGTGADGGFRMHYRFGVSDDTDSLGCHMFLGITKQISGIAGVDPETLTNCIGIGHASGNSNLSIYHGGSAAQARQNLGANFPANTRNTDFYDFFLTCPCTENVHWEVTRVNTGHTASGVISGGATVMPQPTDLLVPINASRYLSSGSGTVGIDLFYMQWETRD
ncbi:MAG TPA: hypothetical protein DIT40_08260 [Alphaproteobacteria bacterium]|nr:hypothetical protein [Alphaproteobacteria bacterium]